MSLTREQIAGYARAAGFPEKIINLMVAISLAESSGVPTAWNTYAKSGGRESSVGLWQINTRVHKRFSVRQLMDPATNAAEAFRIWRTEGITAWGSYTDGRYKQYLTGGGDYSGLGGGSGGFGASRAVFTLSEAQTAIAKQPVPAEWIGLIVLMIGSVVFFLVISRSNLI